MDCKYKSDTGNNRGDWNGLKMAESNIAGKGEIKELQKRAILGTAHCGKC